MQLFFNIDKIVSVSLFWDCDKEKIEKIGLLLYSFRLSMIEPSMSQGLSLVYRALKDFFKNGGLDSRVFEYIDLSGYSDFAMKVYLYTKNIAFGETVYYSDITRSVGVNNAQRAVGRVLSANRYPLIIPCHRVISNKGTGGFKYGVKLKKQLLDYESMFL
jgi:methylated-DNA-[protein]-cysteine S-methyltransferase